MKNAFYLLLVLIGLVVALVTISIGQFFAGVSIRVLEGVKRVRTWRESK
jgi:flagellar motor component MotA